MSMALISERPAESSGVAVRLAEALHRTMVVTSTAQTFHWNVTGMAFGPLHALFQEYEDNFAAQDRVAERIRALEEVIDGRASAALKRSPIKESEVALEARSMVARLAEGQRALSAILRRTARLAEDRGDLVSHDLAVAPTDVHDKFAWMLEAHLAQ